MKEIQRKFIVNKIEKYENEINQIKKSQTLATFGLGFFTGLTLICTGTMEPNLPSILTNSTGIAANLIFAISNAVNLGEKISEKAGLKNTIRDLKHQLDMDNLEQNLYM